MKNQTIFEFTDDKKIKYSSNSNDILKTAKTFYEKLYTKRQPSKLLLATSKLLLAKFLAKRKSQRNIFIFQVEISLKRYKNFFK